jgi:hypothetical protein
MNVNMTWWLPPHFDRQVMAYWNKNYQGRWIGRGGLLAWPADSSDRNTLDFFLCACIKSKMHHSGKPEMRKQLVECIIKVVTGIRN